MGILLGKKMHKRVNELAEKYRDYTAENLSRLVKIKSLSRNEKNVAIECKIMLEQAGLDNVWIDPLGNVIGKIGKGGKSLAFDAHLDTVDVGHIDNWAFDPLSGDIKDGFVLGRGSVDQKGGMAAMITAARILSEIGHKNECTIFFVGSVMEEDCDGLCWKYIVEEDKIQPDCVLSTEPTNLNINIGQRGRMEMEVSFKGLSAHGSAPERGTNAIYLAADVCRKIETLNEKLKTDSFLGKGTAAVTQIISDGPSLCAIPDYAKIHIDRRLTFGETKESALNEIADIISQKNMEMTVLTYDETAYTGLRYGMEKYYPTWQLQKDHKYVKLGVDTFQQLFDSSPKIDKWTFSTNGVTINGFYNIPVLGFGPGEEKMAHAPNERVAIDDLVRASAFYTSFATCFAERVDI